MESFALVVVVWVFVFVEYLSDVLMRKQNSLLHDFMAHFIANCITSIDNRIRQAADETDILSKWANLPVSTMCFCCALRCFIMLLNKLKHVTIRATGGGCQVLLAGTRRFHYNLH